MAAERTAVLGMGNPVVSDDRVGLAVAEELRRLLAEAPIEGVAVLESTRGGFELRVVSDRLAATRRRLADLYGS